MRSLGLDNIGLALRLSRAQWAAIKKACHYEKEDGRYAIIPGKIYFKWMLNFIICDINVPKLVFGHNVLLADPFDLKKALEQCEHLLPFPLPLENAIVRYVHFTYIEDTPLPFDFWRECFTSPNRGKWNRIEQGTGTYFNGKRMRMLFYSKDEHLRSKSESLSKEVEVLCDHKHFIRIELRLDRAVLRQLKEQRLWALPYFQCSDLLSPEGFLALVHLFEWRAPQFFPKAKKEKELTRVESSMLALSENLHKFLKHEGKFGRGSETDLKTIEETILAIQRQECPKQLLKNIHEECGRAYQRFPVQTLFDQ